MTRIYAMLGYISTTDPDASVTRREKGKSKLKYQVHRGVDQKCEVITATEVTPGEVHESHRLESLVDNHEKNTEITVETVIADSKYGSIENYLACQDRDIQAHFSSLEQTQQGSGTKKGIFAKEAFSYNAETDTFTCPAGQTLKKWKEHLHKPRAMDTNAHAGEGCGAFKFKRT